MRSRRREKGISATQGLRFIRRRVVSNASKLPINESIRVDFARGTAGRVLERVRWRRRGAFEVLAFENGLHGKIADAGMLLEVSLRLELVANNSCEVAHVLPRAGS